MPHRCLRWPLYYNVPSLGTTNLMQRLARLPTAPDVSPLPRSKPVPSALSHNHHLHIRWCCSDRLRPPEFSGRSVSPFPIASIRPSERTRCLGRVHTKLRASMIDSHGSMGFELPGSRRDQALVAWSSCPRRAGGTWAIPD